MSSAGRWSVKLGQPNDVIRCSAVVSPNDVIYMRKPVDRAGDRPMPLDRLIAINFIANVLTTDQEDAVISWRRIAFITVSRSVVRAPLSTPTNDNSAAAVDNDDTNFANCFQSPTISPFFLLVHQFVTGHEVAISRLQLDPSLATSKLLLLSRYLVADDEDAAIFL